MNIEQAKKVLKDNGYILHLWCKEDIISKSKEMKIELTEDQVNEVAELIEHQTDCSIGVNWDTIADWIDHVVTK